VTTDILFISHDASVSGAPVVLLHFLRWLKANTRITFKILLRDGGPLLEEFKQLSPVSILPPVAQNSSGWHKLRRSLVLSKQDSLEVNLAEVKSQIRKEGVRLIYANTVTHGALLKNLSDFPCKVISHIHELKYAIEIFGRENFTKVNSYSHHFIAVSQAVAHNLVRHYNVPAGKIDVVYECIDVKQIKYVLPESNKVKQLKEQLSIPEDAFVVGLAGTIEWRKGADLLAPLVKAVYKKNVSQPVYFVWVGKGDYSGIKYDLEKIGSEGKVIFTGLQQNPYQYYSCFDIFVLLSREDPFPLVCLENALLEKPIICFAESGGMSEFIQEDSGGFSVPYLDIDEMATKIIRLVNDQELKRALGRQAYEKSMQFDIEEIGPKLLKVIMKILEPM
jgi:glycosyltransferase involved in cell wall biosynthesis